MKYIIIALLLLLPAIASAQYTEQQYNNMTIRTNTQTGQSETTLHYPSWSSTTNSQGQSSNTWYMNGNPNYRGTQPQTYQPYQYQPYEYGNKDKR